MNKLNGTASSAMILATDAASRLRDGVSRWVPGAIKAIGAGTNLVVLGSGSRKIVGAVRRNPVTAAIAVTAAVGTGMALWIVKRNKRAFEATEGASKAPIEVKSVRVGRKPARRVARKTAAHKAKPATSTKPTAST